MKQNVHFIIPFCIVFSILYIILAIKPLGTEFQFVPQWTTDTTRESESKTTAPGIPFRLGQTIGYFTADGAILHVVTFPYKAAISKSCYTVFGTNDRKIPFFDIHGTEAGTINRSGFPFFDDDRMYLFLPGGSSFAQLADTGAVKWTYEGYAPITAFGSSPAGCVAGLADGTLISFSSDGKQDQKFIPGGSDYPVILGAAISKTGTYLACITGQNNQRFVLAKRDSESHSSIIYYEYLDKPLTRQTLVQFSNDEKIVCFNDSTGLGIVNIKNGTHSHIPLKGTIFSIKESSDGLVFLLSKNNDLYTVSVLEPFDSIAGSFSFKAGSAFIDVEGKALFVGRDSSISRIDVIRQ